MNPTHEQDMTPSTVQLPSGQEPSDTNSEVQEMCVHALYIRDGLSYIAVSKTELEPLGDFNRNKSPLRPTDIFHSEPGTRAWAERMVDFRHLMLSDIKNSRKHLDDARIEIQSLKEKHESLGEALLEKAQEKNWCSEYDDFAEEWDLPKRIREYEVTVTIRVTAHSEDDAEEFVGEHLGLTSYDDRVVDSPYFSASES